MGPEATTAKWFMSGLPEHWHAQRIETTTGRGVPDIELCANGRCCWIELKALRRRPHLHPA